MATGIGLDSTITLAGSGWASPCQSIEINGPNREAIESTHCAIEPQAVTGVFWKEYVPGTTDAGTISLEVQYDPDDPPPIPSLTPSEVMHVVTITFADNTTLITKGFVSTATEEMTPDGLMIMPMTIEASGDLTYSSE